MVARVYRYALLPPEGESARLVDAQMRLALEMRRDVAIIERGRRAALRSMLETPEVTEAVAAYRASRGRARREAVRALATARRLALEASRASLLDEAVCDEMGSCPLYERERIDQLAYRMVDGLYAYYRARDTMWGSCLDVIASARQMRGEPLYTRFDPLAPIEPSMGNHPSDWGTADVQIAVQLQGGLTTAEACSGHHRQVRLVGGELSLRVGSQGRDPIWATWRLALPRSPEHRCDLRLHRAIPDDARWKWVRVSRRREGPWTRWSVEISLEAERTEWRMRDPDLRGAIAVEVCWDMPGDELVVARWRDDEGESGIVELPARIRTGITKPSGIRSVRDALLADVRTRVQRALVEDRDSRPPWLAEAAATMHLWRSPQRFHRLLQRWQDERCDAARPAYELLDAWRMRDSHLYEYETGARCNVLRWRQQWYCELARRWAGRYAVVILDDRDLSREARYGEESSMRFAASPYLLRRALQDAFGRDVATVRYREASARRVATDDEEEEDDPIDWCERAIAARQAGGARTARETSEIRQMRGGAWGVRKANARFGRAPKEAARNQDNKAAE